MNSLMASYPKVRTLFGSTDSILAGGERRHKCVRALICTLVYNYLSSLCMAIYMNKTAWMLRVRVQTPVWTCELTDLLAPML